MKNFSEATAIKSTLQLKMVLDLKAIDICPCQIKINDQLEFYGDLVGNNTIIKHLVLDDPFKLEIIVDRQDPQAVEIVSLKIDDYEIMPLYLGHSSPPTNYIDFTGNWTFKIPNFYPWLHEITGQGWIV